MRPNSKIKISKKWKKNCDTPKVEGKKCELFVKMWELVCGVMVCKQRILKRVRENRARLHPKGNTSPERKKCGKNYLFVTEQRGRNKQKKKTGKSTDPKTTLIISDPWVVGNKLLTESTIANPYFHIWLLGHFLCRFFSSVTFFSKNTLSSFPWKKFVHSIFFLKKLHFLSLALLLRWKHASHFIMSTFNKCFFHFWFFFFVCFSLRNELFFSCFGCGEFFFAYLAWHLTVDRQCS